MPKYTPTISDKEYNLKLVAHVDNDTTVYTYIDDDGDQMLVRMFNDDILLPYVKGMLTLVLNPKTGRKYTVLKITGIGEKCDFEGIEFPQSWLKGEVYEGEDLSCFLKEKIQDAIDALDNIEYAEAACYEFYDFKFEAKPSESAVERWVEEAEDKASKLCEPFLTEDVEKLEHIMELI